MIAVPATNPSLPAAQRGDAEAFCELIAPHEPRLLAQALGLCRNATQAEDLVQETLVEAWKSLRRFDGSCRFETWLYAILLHRHQKALRYARVRPFFCLDAESRDRALEQLQALGGSPAESADALDDSERIRRCLADLPPKHREVISLRFFADAPLEEIAAALGCSLGTVKSRLFYALEKLRKMNLPAPWRDIPDNE